MIYDVTQIFEDIPQPPTYMFRLWFKTIPYRNLTILDNIRKIAYSGNAIILIARDTYVIDVIGNSNYEDICRVWFEICEYIESLGWLPRYVYEQQ